MEYVRLVFGSCLNWIHTLFDRTGTLGVFLGAFGFVAVYRFLLRPLLAGRAIGGSDKAKKKGSNNKGGRSKNNKGDANSD